MGGDEKAQCASCRHLKPLENTEWVDPDAPYTWVCKHPDLEGEKISDIRKFMPRDCNMFERQ